MKGTNERLFALAKKVLPGGVSSPVRAFGSVGGTPLFYERASGARFIDAEGREFVDFVMSWGPLILGHAHPRITAAIHEAAERGTSYGAPCRAELELAELVRRLHPAVEKLRFVSSGTEAVMSAIRVARGATGRDRILKFSGCYHGHSDGLLVAAGSGLVTFGRPSSAGVPGDYTKLTSVLPLDDDAELERFFAHDGDECAVAIVEPLPANNGLLVQRREFLAKLRALSKEHGTLLCFDEVISGFRLGPGGASALYDIEPDLVTFGKVIGGGMPVGAFGGAAKLLDLCAPEGPVYQAGTLSGNPVAMAAGRACLETLEQEDGWARLEELGSRLEDRFAAARARGSIRGVELVRVASLFWLAPETGAPIRSAEAIPEDAASHYAKLHAALLSRGVYLAPSAFEVGFLSTAHAEADVDLLVDAIAEASTGS